MATTHANRQKQAATRTAEANATRAEESAQATAERRQRASQSAARTAQRQERADKAQVSRDRRAAFGKVIPSSSAKKIILALLAADLLVIWITEVQGTASAAASGSASKTASGLTSLGNSFVGVAVAGGMLLIGAEFAPELAVGFAVLFTLYVFLNRPGTKNVIPALFAGFGAVSETSAGASTATGGTATGINNQQATAPPGSAAAIPQIHYPETAG